MKALIILALVKIIDQVRNILMVTQFTTKLLFLPGLGRLRWKIAELKAYARFIEAESKVPAYRKFLKTSGYINGSGFKNVPEMDKERYVKRYSMEKRCTGGKIPSKNVVIDESSGSSGMAMNWVRGQKERNYNKKMLKFAIRQQLGNKPIFVINAFAMGPWATGVNVTMSFVEVSIMKSLGPDIAKIVNTLKFFKNDYHYVVMGYPPFLKTLVDEAGIDWQSYNITMIFGGEAISEAMRDYLINKGIKNVYGSYGASDIELNMAAENDFTIALRKYLSQHKNLGKKFFRRTGQIPMIFQFNPADFLIETNALGELVITVCRPGYISPKIRYNIHDLGHVMQFTELQKILKDANVKLEDIGKYRVDLPLLFHYGRSDMAVAFFGCKITPGDIHETIFGIPALACMINTFNLTTLEDSEADKKLIISLELSKGIEIPKIPTERVTELVLNELTQVNQDFREAYKMIKQKSMPMVQFFEYGTGPFKDNDIRIKKNYITQKMADEENDEENMRPLLESLGLI